MVGAVAAQDLVLAGVGARQLDGVFVGVGAAQGEQEVVQVPGGDLGEQLAQQGARFGRHRRAGIGQLARLVDDGVDHALVAVTDIDAHGHRIEIQVALAVHVPEIDAFGRLDRDRRDFALGRPGPKTVFHGERAGFLNLGCRT